MQRCIDFISYADIYDLAAAAEVVYQPLKEALSQSYRDGKPIRVHSKSRVPRITPADVELIFRVMPEGSRLRSLAAQGALSFNGMHAGFAKQEREVAGFAAEMLFQIRASMKPDFKWKDPITGAERK